MALKDDASEIRAYMQGRASQLNLDNTKKRWPKWVFRSDHIENVAAILEYGKLLSRARAESEKLIFHDSASPEHIAELSTCQGRYVRLYFRPRTPTQYANEGIRPSSKIQYGAHMPVPVYLLFSAELLEEEEIQFTRGRLRSDTEIGDGASFLRSIDFADVYHDGPVGLPGESRRRQILNPRHAEVLAKDELPLNQLKYIVCRSQPERDTLLNLLSVTTTEKWRERIVIDPSFRSLFFKRCTFVRSVELAAQYSKFTFHLNDQKDWRGSFDLGIVWSFG